MEASTTPKPEIEEREISAEEAKRIDQIADPPAEAVEDKRDVLDLLQPKSEPKTWTIGKDALAREYVQRELSFIGKMQWFSLVGEVLEEAMSGPNAMSLNNLFSAPGQPDGTLTMEDFRNADTFVQAVGKLLVHAPDFLEKSFCIWLSVPDYEWDTARSLMAQSPQDGGLSDDDGLEIIEIFIDQNYEAIDSFFRQKLGGLRKRIEARQQDRDSRSSKR